MESAITMTLQDQTGYLEAVSGGASRERFKCPACSCTIYKPLWPFLVVDKYARAVASMQE